MAAVFIICIPTRDYERKLDEKKSLASTPQREKSPELTGDSNVWEYSATTVPGSPNVPLMTNDSNKSKWNVNGIKALDEAQVTLRKFNKTGSTPPTSPNGSPERELGTTDDDECLETVLKIGLEKLKIEGAVWQQTEDKKFIQIVFPCESQERCEHILRHLHGNGIGTKKESSVSVVPCSVYYQAGYDEDDDCDAVTNDLGDAKENDTFRSKYKTHKTEFLKSIKARLTVAQVVDGVRGGATLTFDYVAFVILANFIAGFGLMDNSPVTVVASMLVSPLMGPIMALCFGAVIRDKSLFTLGVKSELIGLLICITVGSILGLIVSPWSVSWGKGVWPTGEMFARGQARSLWLGMLIALPSGAGVALSLLGGNAGCLVGVAISASLLPPCVNAGLLWANSFVLTMRSITEDIEETMTYNGVKLTNKPALLPPPDYHCQYSTNMAYESALLGVVSLCLTLVNIICIIMMAIAVLKIKEVAPPSLMPTTSRFWREDIKITRDYNKTVHRRDSSKLGPTFVQEWAERHGTSSGLAEMVQDVIDEDEVYRTVARCTATQYTQPSRTRDRMSLLTSEDPDSKPAIWDVSFHTPSSIRSNTRRRTVTVTCGQPGPFDSRQSRVSFITEAMNPHVNHQFLQDGCPPPSAPRRHNTHTGHGSNNSETRFKVTKASDKR